jgi:multiple antibiotic resistance protein
MNDVFSYALLALTSFFTLINPLGSMPIFMSMTSQLTHEERNKTAKKASIVALFTIIAFAFTGQFLFKFFGISVDSLRVVGGVIFFIMGLIVMVIAVEFFFSGLKPILLDILNTIVR